MVSRAAVGGRGGPRNTAASARPPTRFTLIRGLQEFPTAERQRENAPGRMDPAREIRTMARARPQWERAFLRGRALLYRARLLCVYSLFLRALLRCAAGPLSRDASRAPCGRWLRERGSPILSLSANRL